MTQLFCRTGRALRRRPGIVGIALAMAALALWAGAGMCAEKKPLPEYQLKAVFLYNFAQFVEWPEAAFPETQTPLVIGVLGEDPFGSYLDETVRGERVNNRPLVVERYRRAEEIKICHILFISRTEADRLEKIFGELKERNILTVGDFEGFAKRGGMMRFVTEKHKTRLRINLEAVKAARLTVSSKLLRPAEIIRPGKD